MGRRRAGPANRRIAALERAVRALGRVEVEEMPLRKLFFRSFLGGVFRGIGTAVGVALVGTLGVYLLSRIAQSDMPGLASFLAEIVRWVQRKL